MGFGPLFEHTKRRGWLAGLVSVVLLFGLAATIHGDLPKDRAERDRDRDGGRALEPSTIPVIAQFDPNRVIAFLTERGEFGASAGSVAGGGFWRATTDQYIFSSGINVGAVANGDTLVAIGGPFSELGPGSPVTPGLDVFWTSQDPADVASFPEVCTVDTFRQTIFPSLQPFGGEPFPGFADQTFCLAVNDVLGGSCSDCAGTRLGIESAQTYFGFGVPAVQDFGFVIYRIFNRSAFVTADNAPGQTPGPFLWENTTVAVAIDPDVGEAGDDQIAFLPDVRTMVYWDSDFTEPQFQNPPGFGGVTALDVFLSTQVGAGLVPAQDEVGFVDFTAFTNGQPRPDPASKEEWYQGMTGDLGFVILEVSPQDIRGMVATSLFNLPAGEFVEVYAAFFFADATGALPSDLRAEAFKDLGTGEILPNANTDPVFDNFKNTQRTAQSVFDAGFIVPVAPPKPNVELIPGDGRVTVTWDGSPVEAVNPFAKVARDPFTRLPTGEPDPDADPVGSQVGPNDVVFDPASDQGGTTGFIPAADLGIVGAEVTNAAFNPDFVIQDFQAFKVWRSFSGQSDDAELIALSDLSDGIVSGEFCVDALTVFDDAGVPFTAVCTAREDFQLGSDSGLNFAVIDRGGTFPNPAAGSGLINGIPVFYSVTSLGVNCGEFLVDVAPEFRGDLAVPPACLALEGGIPPMFSATPRSDASSLTQSSASVDLLDGDGNVVGDQPDLPITDDFELTAPIPAARDFDLDVAFVQPLEVPENFTVLFRIDSAPVSPGFAHPNGCGSADTAELCVTGEAGVFDEIPAGDNRSRSVWFSVTDGSGNVLQTPTGPAVGNVLTDFISFTGVTSFTGPTIQVLAPNNPDAGVAFTLTYSSSIGRRSRQCSLRGTCVLTTPGGSGLPAGVADASFSRGLYGQYRVADLEVTWSNQGGELSLSSVRDVSNNVDLFFTSGFGTEQWGFGAPTGLAPPEDAFATAVETARTDDGRVIFPDPFCFGWPGNCVNYGFLTAFTQAAPVFTDLPVLENVFSVFEPSRGSYVTSPHHQPGALSPTATLVNTPDGKRGTRLYISGHWLTLTFDELPSDGETWMVRLPIDTSEGEPPRPPVPGMAVRVQLTGSTNELADADLSRITVVPNPFIAANEIQRGRGTQRILFTQLPPRATIRIYTVSGNLVRILEHTDGSGTAEWDVRTRFDLIVSSGIYYWHVTTPDGRTQLGRLAVVN